MIDFLKLCSTPLVWSLSLLLLGLWLARNTKQQPSEKWGRRALLLGTLIIFLLSLKPVANSFIYALESEYKPAPNGLVSGLDVVVILGGGIYPSGGLRVSSEPSGLTYSRVCSGVDLFIRSSAKTLVLSGGIPEFAKQSEAEVMASLVTKLGVSPKKVILETKSRNTIEQVYEIEKIFPPKMRKRIGIVTSAAHMSRSYRAFQKRYPKEDIVPLPVNYISSLQRYNIKSFVPSVDAFQISCSAIHEWIGMVWYFCCKS